MNTTTTKGFTLIELLVVVAIIGILAGIIITSLSNAREKARDARRDADIKTIQTALEIYYLDNGHYPIRNWTLSYNDSWSALENSLGSKIPRDPINETIFPWQGGLSYGYYAGSQYNTQYVNCPLGQFYLLVYGQEGTISPEQNPGVARCDTGVKKFGGAVTVGMSPAQ